MELIEKLGIDWKLLLAQVVNFLIILFVLRRFAYRPILGLLERRTKKIEQGVKRAEELEVKQRELEQRVVERMNQANADAQTLLADAETAAAKLKTDVVQEAKQEADKIAARAKAQLQEERTRILREVRGDIAGLVVATTEKVLAEQLDGAGRKRLLESAIREIEPT